LRFFFQLLKLIFQEYFFEKEACIMNKSLWIFFLVCSLFSLNASDPTFDRLLDDIASPDFVRKDKALSQMIDLCSRGNSRFLKPYLQTEDEVTLLAALEVAALIQLDPDVLKEVFPKLKHRDKALRLQAVRVLGNDASRPAVEFLIGALTSTDQEFLVAVVEALGRTGDPSVASSLTSYLSHQNRRLRYAAAYALWLLRTAGFEAEVFEACEREEDPNIRIFLLSYLILQKDARGRDLEKYADVRDGFLRHVLIDAYVKADDKSILPAWRKAMTHDSWRVRFDAAVGLGFLAQGEDIPRLIQWLADSHPEVRQQVNESLKKISKADFGFQGFASKKEREKAIGYWRNWWRENAYRFDQKP
jgi:hypothetical protein